MKTIFNIFLYLILSSIVLFASLNLLYLFANYLLNAQLYDRPSSSSNSLPSEVQEMKDYCINLGDELNFVTVTQYLNTVPTNYYTWRVAEDGRERENRYYMDICFISLQLGRPLTGNEGNRLALNYTVPSIEFIYGFLSRWFLWLIAIFSLWKIISDLIKFIKRKQNPSSILNNQESSNSTDSSLK